MNHIMYSNSRNGATPFFAIITHIYAAHLWKNEGVAPLRELLYLMEKKLDLEQVFSRILV